MTTDLETTATAASKAAQAKTVLFITGAWMHTSSWDKFRSAFEAAGYRTLARPGPISKRPPPPNSAPIPTSGSAR